MIAAPAARPSALAAQGSDHDHSDRLRHRRRPGQARPRRQPQPAGRQRHRRQLFSLTELAAKRLGLLQRAGARRRASSPCSSTRAIRALRSRRRRTWQAAALAARARTSDPQCQHEREIDARLRSASAQAGVGALFVQSDPFFISRAINSSRWRRAMRFRRSIAARFAEAGGLMSYGSNADRRLSPGRRLRRPHSQGRQAGRSAGRSSRPSSSSSSTSRPPRRSASTLPPTLLARADEVIE